MTDTPDPPSARMRRRRRTQGRTRRARCLTSAGDDQPESNRETEPPIRARRSEPRTRPVPAVLSTDHARPGTRSNTVLASR